MATTTPQLEEERNSLEIERESIMAQLNAQDGDAVPAQESVTPEGADHAAPTEEEVPAKVEGEEEPETEKKEVEGKPDREAKEEARKEKSWAEINRRKAEIDARAKTVADREAEIERLRAEAAEKAATAGQFSADDFDAAAKRFEAEGDDSMAEQARARANQIRQDVAAQKQKSERLRLENEWKTSVAKAKEDHPELNDPTSPLAKTVAEVFKNRPVMTTYPGGVQDAVAVAQLKLKADNVESLQKELDALRAKAEAQEKKLQPGGSTPSVPGTIKSFESLSMDEQGKYLAKLAKEADGVAEFFS